MSIQHVNHHILTIQSSVRTRIAIKQVEKMVFERAQSYAINLETLATQPCASQGKDRKNIYIPNDLSIVIRHSSTNQFRLKKMKEARFLCSQKQFHHLVVPEAKVSGDFLFEKKLPNDNDTIIKGMGFYYEHREYYKAAVQEFTSFLCYASLDDIIGNINHPINYLGIAPVPRFDNLLLYSRNELGKIVYKIGLIDLEGLKIRSSFPDIKQISYALSTAAQLFPYHVEEIIEVGKTFCSITDEIIATTRELSLEGTELYETVYVNILTFFAKHNITLENSCQIPTLSCERKSELKEIISAFVCKLDQGSTKYFGTKGCLKDSLENFKEKLLPKMLDYVEKGFQKCLPITPSINQAELIQKRLITKAFTDNLRILLLSQEEEFVEKIVDSLVVVPIFEEILNQMVLGGEIAFYKRSVCGGHRDCLFF